MHLDFRIPIRKVDTSCSRWLLVRSTKCDVGVPQGSVLSATLFLLHINYLLVPGTFGYADESTVADRDLPGATPEGMLLCLVERLWLIA